MDMPTSRIDNIERCKRHVQQSDEVVTSFPLFLYIEASNACNLRCPMCPITLKEKDYYLGGKLLDERLLDILRPSFPYIVRASLAGGGEPLVNPHCVAMIQELKSNGVEVGFSTNGTLLTPELSQALAAAGMDYISLSIDSADPENYERIRKGARFEKTVSHLEALSRARQGPNRNPFVSIQMTVSRENVSDIDGVIQLAARNGVDHLLIEPLTPAFTGRQYRKYFAERFVPREEILDRIRQAEKDAHNAGITHFSSHYLKEPVPTQRCVQPWLTLGVRVNGATIRCCGTAENMGSIQGDLWGAWNSKAFRKVRKTLASRKFPSSCKTCASEGRCAEFNVDLLGPLLQSG